MSQRTQTCPSCGDQVTMEPYDIGSGPEMSCSKCEWCWGADGQDLSADDTSMTRLRRDIARELRELGIDDVHSAEAEALLGPAGLRMLFPPEDAVVVRLDGSQP